MEGNGVGPEQITREDVQLEAPEVGGTGIVVQRHEEYIRDRENPRKGSLKEQAALRAQEQTRTLLRQIVDQIPPEQRNALDIMVIASPTQYEGGGRRSMETMAEGLKSIREVMSEKHLSPEQLLNNKKGLPWGGGPIPSKMIVEPKILYDSPEFVGYLKEEFGKGEMNKDAWTAYEIDKGDVKEKRVSMGAEGPYDIADRLAKFLYAIKAFSVRYHQQHPGKRLLVWAGTHYDTISPYLKTRIKEGDPDRALGVDYGAGFGINIKPDGSASTKLGGVDYKLDLVKPVVNQVN